MLDKAYYYFGQINMGFSNWTYTVRQFRYVLHKCILSYLIASKSQKVSSALKNLNRALKMLHNPPFIFFLFTIDKPVLIHYF